jgi:DNA-binding CsgD family transcriptional regulator
MRSDKTVLTAGKYLYIAALIGLGFLWMGTAYMVQVYRLLTLEISEETVNLLVCGAYYVCQAAGIGAVAFVFHKRPALAGGRALPVFTTLSGIAFMAVTAYSSAQWLVITSGALLNLAIGVLSCCNLTRLATDIPQKRRGIVFGVAYAFGSLGTWLISLPMEGRLLWDSGSFFAVAALALVTLPLVKRLEPVAAGGGDCRRAGFGKKLIILAAAVLILLSMENTLGFSFPLRGAKDSVYIEFTRVFYGLGLVAAGYVSDKSRRWGAVCCLAVLAFPFAALALGGNAQGETVMWILAYLFLGFWSVHRILVFSDIAGKTGLPVFAVLGLLMGRLGEAAGTLGAVMFTGAPLVALAGVVFALVIALFLVLYQKLYAPAVIPAEVMEQQRLAEYARRFGLSAREKDILSLIVKGMSNAEIANALYITESTVKFHVGNIFKKTGKGSRLELIADYKLGREAVH